MRWAKEHLHTEEQHNLGNSGVRRLLTAEELGLADAPLPLFGHNDDGYPPLLEAIATRFSVNVEQVLAAEGTSLANFLTLAAWIRPGDPVLLEDPGYEPLGSVLSSLEARIERVRIDGKDGPAALLAALARSRSRRWRAVVMTHPHNPTGLPVEERLLDDLDRACAEQGAILLVDEAYREVLFENPPGCAARGREATVSTSSLTKAYGLSALRIGWAVGPKAVIDRARAIHDNLGVVHPFVTEAIGARLIADAPRMDRLRGLLRARIAENRAALATFHERRAYRFEAALPERGILYYPRWRGEGSRIASAEDLCRRALEAGIVLVPGRFFRRDEHIRIAVGGPPLEVRTALEAFDEFLEKEVPA
jgi:aspartate/methionine/tyrosine aminotransferase